MDYVGIDVQKNQSQIAQFLTLWSASNLAEARCLCSPLQGSSPTKTRASSRPSRAYGPHLRPSTHCEKLSEASLGCKRNIMRTLVHRAGQQRSRSRRTRIAALWPAAPITEPAGWQPAEHEYSPAIGVTYGSRSAKPNPLST